MRPMICVLLMACGVESTDETASQILREPLTTTSVASMTLGYCQEPGDDPDGCCAFYMGCDTTGRPVCTSPPEGTCYELTCQTAFGDWYLTGGCR